TVVNGNGGSQINIDATSDNAIGSLRVSNGDGDDTFVAGGANFTVSGAITLSYGSGGDGGGNADTYFAATANTVGGALTITSTQGDDPISLGAGAGTLNLHSVTINQGNGSNSVTFNGLDNTVTGNLSITNGDGFDNLNVNGNTFAVTGTVTVN